MKKYVKKLFFLWKKKNTGINIQELYREKQDIFASGKRKVLFFYLAHQLYGNIKKKTQSFWETISIIDYEM